jgi:thiol-disulfide isomerase/thioredoxin
MVRRHLVLLQKFARGAFCPLAKGATFAALPLLALTAAAFLGCARAATPTVAPELTHRSAADWINSQPLSLKALRGKVVLIEFWTFECVNCLRSGAWVKSVANRHAKDGLVVIGVHTPELPEERSPENVRAAVKRLGIEHPVMIDGDFSYWNAMGNQYWPAFYVLDAQGRIQNRSIGEMHVNEPRARQIEAVIEKLLAERGA